MNRPIWKMYWPNGCAMTVKRMQKECEVKFMDMETIKRINSNLEILANAQKQAGTCYEANGLKNWQWEIMLRDESERENRK